MINTLVTDTGDDIVGIFSVRKKAYKAYRGDKISIALALLTDADEVVTYNGNHADLKQLGKFARLADNQALPLKGVHTDMREIVWSERIWGRNLSCTYHIHFKKIPTFPDTHEGSNERDVYMTLKLWKLWKASKLKILDGQEIH